MPRGYMRRGLNEAALLNRRRAMAVWSQFKTN